MSDDEILEPCMKEKEDEFKEEEALKVDKSQENHQQAESNIDIPTLQSRERSHEEEGSSNIAPQMNTAIKRIKLTAQSIPNWLIEGLDWIKRTELADSSLSTSHGIFERLCWPKLHGRKVKAHRVSLMSLRDSESPNPRSKLMLCVSRDNVQPLNYTTIPIANIRPPEYITGFNEIDLRFLDGPILEFMENMLPYFDPIQLNFLCAKIKEWNANDIRIGPIRRLLSILAPKIHQLCLNTTLDSLCDFNRLFPGIIEEIQLIALEAPKISDCDLLLQWLNTERADGKPKTLCMFYGFMINTNTMEEINNFIERVKQEFLHSKQKATFIILLGLAYFPDGTLENGETGEVLSICQGEFELQNGEIARLQYLIRHPKGMEWTNFVKELLWYKEGWTSVLVEIEDPPQRKWKYCSIL